MGAKSFRILTLGFLLVLGVVYSAGIADFGVLDDRAVIDTFSTPGGFLETVLSNQSGPTGRPVAMVTLWVESRIAGFSLSQAKAVNVFLHALCVILVVVFVSQLLRASRIPTWFAIVPAAAWALAPIQVSTVLYVSQRMTILCAVFVLGALITFIKWRADANPSAGTSLRYVLQFGVLFSLAVLSKETAALLPLFLLLTEGLMSQRHRRDNRHRLFLAAFAIAPLILAAALFALNAEQWLSAYKVREFTLAERLLTETRVLWHYAAATLFPSGDLLGLFHDDYRLSTGLLSPPTTILSCAGLALMIGCAAWLRQRAPLVAYGMLFFLIGHALEGSILPLEIYFEHRNYLPSLGLWLVAGAVAWRLHERLPSLRRALAALAVLAVALYGALTWQRASLWSNPTQLFVSNLQHHPDSFRLHTALAGLAINRCDYDLFSSFAARAEEINPSAGDGLRVHAALFACRCPSKQNDAILNRLGNRVPTSWFDPYFLSGIDHLAKDLATGNCPGLSARSIAEVLEPWTRNPTIGPEKDWRGLHRIGVILALGGNLDRAEAVQREIWERVGAPAIGLELAAVLIAQGKRDEALAIIEKVEDGFPFRYGPAAADLRRRLD